MRYTLDTCGWPLVINDDIDDGKVVALVLLPTYSAGDDEAGLAAVERARQLVELANRGHRAHPVNSIHPDAPPVPAGMRPRAGVEYGCGHAECDDCYEPISR